MDAIYRPQIHIAQLLRHSYQRDNINSLINFALFDSNGCGSKMEPTQDLISLLLWLWGTSCCQFELADLHLCKNQLISNEKLDVVNCASLVFLRKTKGEKETIEHRMHTFTPLTTSLSVCITGQLIRKALNYGHFLCFRFV